MNELEKKAVEIALDQNGVRESGNNTGREVNQYLRAAGCPPGNPWCAAFVYWCIDEAADDLNVTNPFVRTAYCPDIANWARQHDMLDDRPEPGDVFLRYGTVGGEFRACHTGFVTAVHGSTYDTVEGNTNTGGGREGIGVFKRTRPISSAYKFVHWGRLAPKPSGETYRLVLSGREICDMPVMNGRALCPVRKWGEALGFEVGWDAKEHVPLLDGKPLDADIIVLKGTAYAAIRDLVEFHGLKLDLDEANKRVLVHR